MRNFYYEFIDKFLNAIRKSIQTKIKNYSEEYPMYEFFGKYPLLTHILYFSYTVELPTKNYASQFNLVQIFWKNLCILNMLRTNVADAL